MLDQLLAQIRDERLTVECHATPICVGQIAAGAATMQAVAAAAQLNRCTIWNDEPIAGRVEGRMIEGMGIFRLGHVEVRVPDLELCAAYYTEVLGLREVERDETATST